MPRPGMPGKYFLCFGHRYQYRTRADQNCPRRQEARQKRTAAFSLNGVFGDRHKSNYSRPPNWLTTSASRRRARSGMARYSRITTEEVGSLNTISGRLAMRAGIGRMSRFSLILMAHDTRRDCRPPRLGFWLGRLFLATSSPMNVSAGTARR